MIFTEGMYQSTMFSLVITNAFLDTTESMVRNAFEQLELGSFDIHMVQAVSKGRDCLKIFVNFTNITDKGSVLHGRLMENAEAQKNGQRTSPISIYYESYRGRERYWNVYLTKTFEKCTERTEFKVRIEL